VVLHGARADEQLRGDLAVGVSLCDEARNLRLLWDPHEAGGQRVIFLSGDDADAKKEVVALFEDEGFAAIDLGDLATGGEMQQIHHPLAGLNLIRTEEGCRRTTSGAVPLSGGDARLKLARYGVEMVTFEAFHKRVLDRFEALGPIELRGLAYSVLLFRAAPS
jgi:hypothetical protein